MQNADVLVFLLLVAILLVWLAGLFRKWLTAPPKTIRVVEPDEEIPVTDAVALLEESGYEVMTTKRKVPIRIRLNGDQELESRLFVDHFANDGDNLYIVKLARERQPLEMTGSGIRNQLLVYHLLYEEAAGILYVDPRQRTIHKIQFEVTA
ncbi:hypothetical protein N6H14_31145 [Paenibacillus sp. CC-CFT747]|nr:hypothetical protein N6H14_31145 [Paenibacillus sp. CC-CFT747]